MANGTHPLYPIPPVFQWKNIRCDFHLGISPPISATLSPKKLATRSAVSRRKNLLVVHPARKKWPRHGPNLATLPILTEEWVLPATSGFPMAGNDGTKCHRLSFLRRLGLPFARSSPWATGPTRRDTLPRFGLKTPPQKRGEPPRKLYRSRIPPRPETGQYSLKREV